ncbi:hypothetical protein TSUD_302230, partial [Trifolium subterraneum]
KQKINSPSWTNAPIQFQGSSIYYNYNQHVPQYAFPLPVYRAIIMHMVDHNFHFVGFQHITNPIMALVDN